MKESVQNIFCSQLHTESLLFSLFLSPCHSPEILLPEQLSLRGTIVYFLPLGSHSSQEENPSYFAAPILDRYRYIEVVLASRAFRGMSPNPMYCALPESCLVFKLAWKGDTTSLVDLVDMIVRV